MHPRFPSPRSDLRRGMASLLLWTVAGSLAHDVEGSVPAGEREEVESQAAQLPQPYAGGRRVPHVRIVLDRPVDDERPPLEIALGHRSPIAGVVGIVAVVAHAEVAGRGHRPGAEVVARTLGVK